MRFLSPLTLAFTLLAALCAKPALAETEPGAVCGVETAHQERLTGIPDRLLHAISLVESGRWDANRRESFAWPWTVTAEGEGQFLPNKAAAIALVQRLHHEGVTNIDVGCMQVNLQAHPDAFKTLDEAFEPSTNVAFAARFLIDLHDSTGNWPTAGAYYHSQTPPLAAAYKAKLVATWDAARSRPDSRLEYGDSDDLAREVWPPVGLLMASAEPSGASATPAAQPAKESADREAQGRTAAERAEAKSIADAFRQARLDEYRKKKLQLAFNRG